MSEPLRRVKVWTPIWWDRLGSDEPTVECSGAKHFADTWFHGCPHEPTSYEFTESARALCDETDVDHPVLEVISKTYFTAWSLSSRHQRHIEQWPLALIVLAGLREAGYEVVRANPQERLDQSAISK